MLFWGVGGEALAKRQIKYSTKKCFVVRLTAGVVSVPNKEVEGLILSKWSLHVLPVFL